MAAETTSYNISDPDIFNRGSLQLTYDLIRKKDAQLALNVRNIIGREPLPKEPSALDNQHSDYFRVELDSFQVRAIVETLMKQAQKPIEGKNNSGMVIVAKTLLEDWMPLVRKMIAELPDEYQILKIQEDM